jgi:hypothetical protein
MATYGGVDTSGLGGADLAGRQQKLKAQMDYAQQVNQGLQGAGQQIQSGLNQVVQYHEAEKNRKLEAARAGLEFDTANNRYTESPEAKQKRTFEQGRQVAEYGLEKDYKTSEILQRQQQLGIEQQKVNLEGGLKQQDSATRAKIADVDAMREERLMMEYNTKTGVDKLAARDKIDAGTDKLFEDNTSNMIKLATGDAATQKATIALLAPLADKNPALKQALQNSLTGQTTPDDMKQILSTLQEQRNQIALSGAAKTGYISPLVDPSSPTMQQYYAFRNLYTKRMEGDMAAEMQILKMLPDDQKAGFQQYLRLTPKTQEERVRLANQASAQGYLGITMARLGAGVQGGGQSGGTGSGGTGGAGASTGTGQSKLGGAGSELSQPYWQGRPGNLGYPPR